MLCHNNSSVFDGLKKIVHNGHASADSLNEWLVARADVHTYHKNGGRTINIKAFTLTDLRAIGVLCEADEIKLTDEVHVGVPRLQFTRTLEKHSPASVVVPVYLYSNRAKFLFGLHLLPIGFDHSMLSQRGVAFVSNLFALIDFCIFCPKNIYVAVYCFQFVSNE
ncbi:hypothetical protein niasHT_005312 [Heterodera trifolii]|uniref:Uncharacterized protein n=1 Tax=Heterodera trifolii TaxID=157864 RepID=A0ABD2M0P5_9BILA